MPPELEEYILKAMRDWDVPGLAITIVKDDQVVAAKGYGVRELGKPDRVDGRTLFDIASLTKSFTAAGAAVLVDDGKLRWDDRVRELLPRVEFADPYIGREATLRDLLCHRTGLQPANAMFMFTGIDREEVLRRVRYLQPQAPFRTEMVYSSVLYTVAGEMAAAAAGTSWAELIRHRLIEPAGMRSTLVETRPPGSTAGSNGSPRKSMVSESPGNAPLPDGAGERSRRGGSSSGRLTAGESPASNVASPHAMIGGVQQPIRPFDFAMVGPSASMLSNAEDMARWLRLHLNEGTIDGKQIVSRSAMEEMHTPQIIIRATSDMRRARLVEYFGGYGLGWQIMDYRGEPLLWHSGNADGMPSYMALLPRRKLGVAVFLNTWGAPGLHGALVSRIMDVYLGAEPRDWSGEALARYKDSVQREAASREEVARHRASPSSPSRPLADYAGLYEAPLFGPIHVRAQGGSLTFQAADGPIADLSGFENDSFLIMWRDPLMREYFYGPVLSFVADEKGRVDRLSVTLNRDQVEAKRAAPPAESAAPAGE